MPRAVAAIFALIILAGGATVAFQASLETAGEDHTVVNETFSPGSGGVVQLADSERANALYAENVTVENGSHVEMAAGEDYEWIEDNGTLRVLSGGDLAGDANGFIWYSYAVPTAEQRGYAEVLSMLPSALGVILPVFLFVLLLIMLRQ